MSAGSALGAAEASADVSLTLNVGMGSRACSRNSKMLGVIIVSSGILCKVNHADKVALFAPDFLPKIKKKKNSKIYRRQNVIKNFLPAVIQVAPVPLPSFENEAEGSKNKVSSFSTFEMY